jgi:putative acetyltransferase
VSQGLAGFVITVPTRALSKLMVPDIRPALAADLTQLIEGSDLLMRSLYPSESNHLVEASSLEAPGNMLYAAFLGNQALGCVGLLRTSSTEGEIKRLFIDPNYRGQGIARRLMGRLEGWARGDGVTTLRLETGIHQPESVALYESLGYERRGPFSTYVDDPLSIFMEKFLG